MSGLFEPAPAKINLALHVTGRRADGYHELESLVVFSQLGDELTARPADADRLILTGPFASALSAGQSNLVLKALAAFRGQWPEALPHGLEVTLSKNLPVASGIGGGSADAAAALRLVAAASRTPVPPEALQRVALVLGADVPVCLHSVPCVVRGIGEIVRPVIPFPAAHAVLVNPLVNIATADVFRRLVRRDNPGLPPIPEPMTHLTMLGLWLEETRNDLEAAATDLCPAIGAITGALRQTAGCVAARMSGSGATVFGLFGSAAAAHQAAHDLRMLYPDYWVAATPISGMRTASAQ